MIGEVVLQKVGIGREDLDHRLGEPLHVSVPDAGVEALKLLQHLEARGQLRDIATGPLNTYSRAESGYHQTPTHGRAATVPKRRPADAVHE